MFSARVSRLSADGGMKSPTGYRKSCIVPGVDMVSVIRATLAELAGEAKKSGRQRPRA